jgi:creatinine amidohydrolase
MPDDNDARPTEQLASSRLPDMRSAPPRTVVVPFGATEPHGCHLPYGTDVYETDAIAARSCQLARAQGAAVVALPTIPFGVQTSQQAFPLAMNLYPSTLNTILADLTETLDNSGVEKAVVLNGHGGNDFYTQLRELYGKRNVYLMQVSWFRLCEDLATELFTPGGDHANDMETSLMLHLRPELVDMSQAGAQSTAAYRIRGMREGWAKSPRPWERYTEDSGAGDPRAATAEKGKRYFEAICQELAEFLIDLDAAEMDDAFPFERSPSASLGSTTPSSAAPHPK